MYLLTYLLLPLALPFNLLCWQWLIAVWTF